MKMIKYLVLCQLIIIDKIEKIIKFMFKFLLFGEIFITPS